MGTFNINITAVGGHGCEKNAKAGEPLYRRCGKFTCPDCIAYDLTQRLKQAGMLSTPEASSKFTHWPGTDRQVVDDLLKNVRESGDFNR